MEQSAKKMKIAELASKQSTDTLEEYRVSFRFLKF